MTKQDVQACTLHALTWSLFFYLLSPRAAAGEVTPPKDPPPPFVLIELKDLPDFKKDVEQKCSKSGKVHVDGLVSTINFEEYKAPASVSEEKFEFEPHVSGFKEKIKLHVLRQPHPAPLAITLLGFYGKSDQKLARTWHAYLYEAGCHVVSFDSVFREGFNKSLGHGVPGNLSEEAKVVAKFIDLILDYRGKAGASPPLRQQTTSVRLLGTSYGGSLALHLLKLPQTKTWPIDRALLLSPPIKMLTAVQQVDTFQRLDLCRFDEISLAELMGGYTPKNDAPTERERALMRAGIAYGFYGNLKGLVNHCDKQYLPGTLLRFKALELAKQWEAKFKTDEAHMKARHEGEMKSFENEHSALKADPAKKDEYKEKKKDREGRHKVEANDLKRHLSDAEYWTFKDYVENLVAPYWKAKPDDIWAQGDLETLLKDAPPFVQAVITADDPLNKPDEFAHFQTRIPSPKALVLPHGGHVGYAGTAWIHALLVQYFKASAASPKPPVPDTPK